MATANGKVGAKRALREAQEKESQLQTLAQAVGERYHTRAKLAYELLGNIPWVEQKHKGSVSAARKYLEETYFLELSGSMNLGHLIAIYRAFPDRKDWEKYRYHLTRLYAEVKERQAAGPQNKEDVEEDDDEDDDTTASGGVRVKKSRRTATFAELEALRQERDELRAALTQERKASEEKDRKIGELEQKLRDLEQRHARIEGQLEAMRSGPR
jgi:hypothetical protein